MSLMATPTQTDALLTAQRFRRDPNLRERIIVGALKRRQRSTKRVQKPTVINCFRIAK